MSILKKREHFSSTWKIVYSFIKLVSKVAQLIIIIFIALPISNTSKLYESNHDSCWSIPSRSDIPKAAYLYWLPNSVTVARQYAYTDIFTKARLALLIQGYIGT